MCARWSEESVLSHHRAKVENISRSLGGRSGSTAVSLKKRSPPHQVPKPRDLRRKDQKIDLSALDEILEIDAESRTCVVEPGVTFVDLVSATLPHGLVPTVVPELKTITVGGAICGASLESMSFRYGGFHDSCIKYEMLTAEGEVLECTPTNENSLIFHMLHGSFGTLGILTKITFRLVSARPFVHLTYEAYDAAEDYQAAIEKRRKDQDVDFLDGIIHDPNRYI